MQIIRIAIRLLREMTFQSDGTFGHAFDPICPPSVRGRHKGRTQRDLLFAHADASFRHHGMNPDRALPSFLGNGHRTSRLQVGRRQRKAERGKALGIDRPV